MSGIKFTLEETLDRLKITRNRLAVEAKIRPNTISDLAIGKTKRLEFATLISILDELNRVAKERGERAVTIEDIIAYDPDTREEGK
ncbi:helix-turn-helix domain-containing protein [Brevibacillus laterosporus]|uniref:XRE family transcriptional regulator n=1 Tax=Brevibacillus laterosporus TaxID=1465 RepID=A0AAP8Q9C9_BRELA|nr:helix-turn-helix transcriptional regulator [Brevibacillus laterosporus]MED1663247.1 helix-turn-helix transcriptional regulator [Brevibacillus laterosporus]MED1669446.1 helix-turn-helix transcriptional regulator [Brevibacillus laterosporus]MED1717726.1 helix-turn-helix transcriptional regulator [Brevibacillus laterosporus]PPA84469.1 XRE family transcriptional regulator [Brevibacillus laterosporus]PPA91516.1 XRE family transcriptional regulator [Brevibacillus laterosporus]